MTNTYFSEIAHYQDLESVNYHADAMSLGYEAETVMRSLAARSRDNARTPMQWDGSSQAGFTQGTPWLPVNPNYVTINAEAAIADRDSVFHHYQRLITLRHDQDVVALGEFALLLPDHDQLWAFTRTLDGRVILVVANCSSETVTAPWDELPNLDAAQVLLATHAAGAVGELQPWESRVYLLP
jgi:oligo-1,6-glucosidase